MAKRRIIQTSLPGKGDLVVGHKVYVFFADPELPAVPGKIVAVSASGHSVTLDVGLLMSVMGLPQKTEWTWRSSTQTYQQKGQRTARGVCLAIERAA